jgi:hypothetical protein
MRPALAVLMVLVAVGAGAQQSARRATNLAAVINYPGFYHTRPVVLVGTLALRDDGSLRLTDESLTLPILFKGSTPDGLAEVRGEFWDVGRMNTDDPRLTSLDVRRVLHLDPEAPWPRAGQVMVVIASSVTAATAPSLPTIRNMVLFPGRYREQKVTVVGQFAGRNLLGDLADAPGRSRYDFVLRSADAAVWVANMRPRGKDFELALDARIDTGRWLEITGTLQQGRGLQWLDAEAGSLKIAKPPAEQAEEPPIRVPAAPPPEVVFSAPTNGETEVMLNTAVRLQFSRDVEPGSLKGRLRIEYAGTGAGAGTAITDFTTEYRAAARVLEIKFNKPLEPLRTIHITFADGVLGVDQQPLRTWSLTFELGPG